MKNKFLAEMQSLALLGAFMFAAPAYSLDVTVTPEQDIQTAINTVLNSGGGTVTLAAGTWTLPQSLTLGSNLTLKGTLNGQKAATVIQGPAAVYSWPLISLVTSNAFANITIKDLVIDGRIPRSVAFDPNNGYFDSYGMYFFAQSANGTNITISNVEVKNTAQGVHAKGITGFTIKDSHFHDNGVMLSNTLGTHNAYLRRVSSVLISNSRFINSWTGDGLHLTVGTGSTIIGSTFVRNYRLGIHVDENAANVDVLYNDISNNGSDLPGTSGYNGAYMSGLGFYATSGRIIGNTVLSNTGIGIVAGTGTGVLENNTALGNRGDQYGPTQIGNWARYAESNNYTQANGPILDGYYRIVSKNSGLTMEYYNRINQKPYFGSSNQFWYFTNLGKGQYKIVNQWNGLAMEAMYDPATTEGTVPLTVYGGAQSQIWKMVAANGGYYRLCSEKFPGMCLDVASSSTSSGASIILKTFLGGDSQLWTVKAP
ncbi:RICIN domain-containing protein [Pseudoduganella namucuonensis]|uniref:Parallel beta-helix repeat (Two copies) n=1 Tax=Pseudoduganella namucuonensis TaxID=1035707 RepID=A0A1I7L887_9BURK|nr:RICIN domain-containing protein [Pseudoduganella namucuonensis]SFV05910.1 parallel beta-helix repeat (two copies) [Pseudoduganella namucuonensis]